MQKKWASVRGGPCSLLLLQLPLLLPAPFNFLPFAPFYFTDIHVHSLENTFIETWINPKGNCVASCEMCQCFTNKTHGCKFIIFSFQTYTSNAITVYLKDPNKFHRCQHMMGNDQKTISVRLHIKQAKLISTQILITWKACVAQIPPFNSQPGYITR